MKKILIVDDNATNRILLQQTLRSIGDFEIVEAVDGNDAVVKFSEENPDLVLMDIMMPVMDGREATKIIKEKLTTEHIPIIFITALTENESLSGALESGGDDFISKPFNLDILASKVRAHLRIRELSQETIKQNTSLRLFNQKLVYEQDLIEYFFESAISQSFLDESIIKYHMSSLSTFNGDLLLSQRSPRGGMYMLMGDFSGHGLTAAMGTLPAAMVFFKMVNNGAAIGDIANEMNSELCKLMPSGMFFTATLLELNARSDVMTLWMGGMPETYHFNDAEELKNIIHSQHMPLGILDDDEFDSSVQVFPVKSDDRVYLYSDGVVETKNQEGIQFGDDNLKTTLINGGGNRFDAVLNEIKKYSQGTDQNDDITLVELNCCKIAAEESIEKIIIADGALLWKTSVSLSENDMRGSDPVSKLSNILCSMPYMSRHKGVLHVVLGEIYSNSLEHGILNIHSSIKKDSEHFLEYYQLRDEALANLKEANIEFTFSFVIEKNEYFVNIAVHDSGQGYNLDKTKSHQEELYGRGLTIIDSFSEKISFSDDGRTMNILYKL